MDVAPGQGPVTARKAATAVAGLDGSPHPCRRVVAEAADVDCCRTDAGDAAHCRVAQPPVALGRCEHGAVGVFGLAVAVDDDRHVWAAPLGGARRAAARIAEAVVAELDEGVPAALRGCAATRRAAVDALQWAAWASQVVALRRPAPCQARVRSVRARRRWASAMSRSAARNNSTASSATTGAGSEASSSAAYCSMSDTSCDTHDP